MFKRLAVTTLVAEVMHAAKTEFYTGNFFDIGIDPTDQTQAVISVTMKKGTWVGFGLGATGMTPGTDMI